ncbi:MAG TPA: FecR domain-containing protein [Rhizomicrobium sp.]|nr:FecR domain-containing protein [Rhizomicrobium sp.]
MMRIGGLQSPPDKAAVRWFLRLQKGELGPEEKGEYQAWLSDQENSSAFKRVERLWGGVDQLAGRPEVQKLREQAVAKTPFTGRIALAIAASLLVLLASAAGFMGLRDHRPAVVAAAQDSAPERGNFFTTIGQRSTVTLRDGSVLTLNTNSSAQVAYSALERKIILLRGQALFEVAKGQKRPFVVYAGDRRIVATGTAFDVRLGNSRVEVTMVEGHVIVDQPALASSRAERRNLELSAGQRLVASAGEPVVTRANVDRVTSWTEGKLVFLDTGLSDAVEESNRYTETPIRLAEPGLATLRINGVFRAGQPAEFARAIAQVYPVAIEYQPDGAITIASKSSP